jgi:hypothetical protein
VEKVFVLVTVKTSYWEEPSDTIYVIDVSPVLDAGSSREGT